MDGKNELPDEVLTVTEVAFIFKLHRRTILTLVATGEMPGKKVGGRWRFSKKVLEKWFYGSDRRDHKGF